MPLPEGVSDWMEAALRDLDGGVARLRWGTGWQALLSGEAVSVVWAEPSAGSRVVRRAYASVQPTVYVTTDPCGAPDLDRGLEDAVTLRLVDWLIGGDDRLSEAASRAVAAMDDTAGPWRPVRRRPAPRPVASPVPAATTKLAWSEITVWLVDGDTVRIEAPGRSPRSYTAAEVGLVHARARDRRHTKGWKLLVALCEGHGSCDWRASDNRSYAAFKVQASALAKKLRAFMGIDAPPFHPTSPADGLRSVFRAGPIPEAEVYVGEDRWEA